MQGKIKIVSYLNSAQQEIFDFEKYFGQCFVREFGESTERCSQCGKELNMAYVFIVKKLQDAGLLNLMYNLLCCLCYSEELRKER